MWRTKLNREAGQALSWGLASHCRCGRLGPLRAPGEVAGVYKHGHRQRHEGTDGMVPGEPMGVPLQAADQGRFILGGAGSCAGECMAGAWIKGETLNSGRSGGSSIHSKGHQYHQTGHGGDVRDTNIDTKDQKHEAQGSQKETTGCRGSDRHQTQQGRHQGQGQRKGEDTSLRGTTTMGLVLAYHQVPLAKEEFKERTCAPSVGR